MPNNTPNPNISPLERELRRLLEVHTIEEMQNGAECELPPDAATSADQRNPRRRREAQQEPEVGVLVTPSPRHAFDHLVLADEIKADILAGLRAIEQRAALDAVFGLSQIAPQRGRCILNFHGDPGTGKTRAAMAIALRLGKPVYQVDYSAVISKYLGDTAKHIKHAFARAKAHGAILFFDEADSLLSRRVDMGETCATSINQNRNVLMQELDRFDGVVVMTTNLFGNYDPALLRRIARHIEFKLPNRAAREKLIQLHLPTLPPNPSHPSNPSYGPLDLAELAKASHGLSGGDILNVCTNAIHAAAAASDNQSEWRLTQELLLAEVRKVKVSKRAHGGQEAARRGPIGFRVDDDRDLEQ